VFTFERNAAVTLDYLVRERDWSRSRRQSVSRRRQLGKHAAIPQDKAAARIAVLRRRSCAQERLVFNLICAVSLSRVAQCDRFVASLFGALLPSRYGKSTTAVSREMMKRLLLVVVLLFAAVPLWTEAQSRFNPDFDHFTTAFPLEGAHATVACEDCHVGAVFLGTPTQCNGSHSQGGRIAASAKPVNHVLSAETCDDCHRAVAWAPIVRMEHDSVYATCATCHNNVYTVGKPPDHPRTQSDCGSCHRALAWRPVLNFDHFGISDNCVSCHNGSDSIGKSATHVATTNVCEDCHVTAAFAPVVRVDHLQVLGACATCHNGLAALGKPPDHIPSDSNCNDCHSTAAWAPALR
jgi:hypothetical protein